MNVVAIATVRPRQRVTIRGEVTETVTRERPWVWLDVGLSDGSGTIVLRFMGRRSIAGIEPHRRMEARGTAHADREALIMLNPLYQFLG